MQQENPCTVADPSIYVQWSARLHIIRILVEEASLRHAFCVALQQHGENSEPQVFASVPGCGDVVFNQLFQAPATIGRETVAALQAVGRALQAPALPGRYRLRCRGQQVAQAVKATAAEDLHLAQVPSRHVLGHLAERTSLVLPVLGPLHPNDGDLPGGIQSRWIAGPHAVKKYLARRQRVEPREDPSRDLEFPPRKPTPQRLELPRVEAVRVVEDDEGTELQHALAVGDSERLDDVERSISRPGHPSMSWTSGGTRAADMR